MAGNRTIVTRLRAEMGQFKKEWNSAGKAVEDAEKKIVRSGTALGNLASDVDNNARAWDVAGKTLMVAGAAMAVGIGYAIKAAIQWEQAWTGVLKTTDGTPKQLAELESGLRSLATQLPASATEIAGVAESAGALGVAREDILSFTKTMVDLGETTNLSADEAATSIAQMANVMKTAPEDIDNLGSTLVALGNDGASTEKQIIEMAQRIAGAGAVIGLSESDVLGLANALASVGIDAEAGGSSVSKILIDISRAVSTNSADVAKWAQVSGMSVDEFSQKWKTSPAEGFEAFTSGLGEVQAAGGDVFTILKDLGQSDVRVTQALLGMAASGDILSDSLKGGAEAWQANTALAEEAEKRYGTTAAQIEIAKNKVNESLISIGEGMLPAVNGALGGFNEILDMFNYLPGPAKSAAGAIGTFGAAFTAASGLAVLAIPKMLQFSDAVRAMESGPLKTVGSRLMGVGKFLMGPWGAALAVAAIPLAIWAKKNADAAQAQAALAANAQAFTATLDKQTGAITAATEQQVIGNLATEGVLTFAKKYGISQGLVTEAALGSKDALAELSDEMLRKDVDLWDNKDVIGQIFGAANAAEKGKKDFKEAADGLAALQSEQLAAGQSGLGLSLVLNGLSPDAVEAQKKLDALRESTQQVSQSFVNFSENLDTKKMGFGEYLKQLEEMAQAQEDWADNLIVATARGVDEGVIEKFKEMGPEGAKRLAELADASDKEIARVNAAFRSAASGGAELADVLDSMPAEVLTEFKTAGDRDAVRTAAEVADKYGMTPGQVETVLRALDYSSADIEKVKDRLADLDGDNADVMVTARGNALAVIAAVQSQMFALAGRAAVNLVINTIRREKVEKAGGGAIYRAFGGPVVGPGTGTSDDIPAMLSNGEHVFTADEVNKAGGQGEIYRLRAAIRAGTLPKFATGGAVSKLDIKNQERTIRDLERSFREREEYGKKPKKGKRKTRLVLKPGSLDWQIAKMELAEAKLELKDLKSGGEARREAAEKAAKAKQDRIDDAMGTRDSVASGLAGGFGLADQIKKNPLGIYRPISGGSIAAGASAYAAKLKAFAGKIEQARRLGIPTTMLQEVAGLGVEEGTVALDALLASSSSEIAQIQTAYRDIDTYAKGAGEVIAKALDLSTAGQDSAAGYAEGFINGLNGYAAQMQAAATAAAQGKTTKPKVKKSKNQTAFGEWQATPAPTGTFAASNPWATAAAAPATASVATPLVLDGAVVGVLHQVAGKAARIEVTKAASSGSIEARMTR